MPLYRLLKIVFIIGILYGLNFLFPKISNIIPESPYYLQILNMIGINIIMAVSLNLISGHTGQFSLGHAGFMAIGAYTAADFTFYRHDQILPLLTSFLPIPLAENLFFLLALLLGGLYSAVAGFLVGGPTLRLKGDYLAIATLGFGEIIRVIILNLDRVGGARGFTGIHEYSNFFWIYLFVLITLSITTHLVYSIKGKALLAIREDEVAAESIGIHTTRYKIIAFTIGAFFAGIGGGLFAHLMAYLHTNSFTFLKSIDFVMMVVLGGMGSITGSVLAAILLTILPEALRMTENLRMIIYALSLILMMRLRPQGIFGMKEFKWFRRS